MTPRHTPNAPNDEGPPPEADWKRLHLWQIQPVRDVLVIAAVFGLVYLGRLLSVVTVPMLLAMALAYLFEPLVKKATAHGRFSRGGAAVVIIALAGVLVFVPVTLGIGFTTVQGVRYAQHLAVNADRLARSVQSPHDQALRDGLPNDSWRKMRDYLVAEMAKRGAPPPPTGDETPAPEPPATESDTGAALQWLVTWLGTHSEAIGKRAIETGAGALEAIARGAAALGMGLFGALLTMFFFYFFCTGYGRLLEFWRGLIPERKKVRTLDLLDQMDRVIAGFIRGRLILCAIMSVYYSLGFLLIGAPAALVLGVATGALVIVPYVSFITVPIAMLLMWLDPAVGLRGEWWWMVAAPVVMYSLGQAILDYVLTPLIQGKAMKMDMATILFVSLAGGVLGGFYGLLLAIPVGACLKILLNEVFWPRFRKWAEGRAKDFLPIEPG